ncbi:MAG: HlyD family type I secretion periplasmic adaptor subunit [Sneathiella sp.]
MKKITIDQDKIQTEEISTSLTKGKPQSSRLGQSIMLEETGPAPLLRNAILFSFVALAAFIAWAQFAEIDEVAVSSGEVIPSGTVQTIQHIDGGTISEIAIEEGDIVRKGQVLIRLDPTDITAEIQQSLTKQAIWNIKTKRLRAFAEGSPLIFELHGDRFDELKKEQENLLKIQRLDLQNQQGVLQAQIDLRIAELDLLADQIRILDVQIEPLREQMAIRARLLKNKTLSRYEFLDAQRQFLKEKGERDELVLTRRSIGQAVTEANHRLKELNGRLKSEALQEMVEANAEALKVGEELNRLKAIASRMTIFSPVDGVVQGLDVNSIGTVVKPGSPIASIVPIDQELILETRIRPEDIGFLQIGQKATVKFTTYNFSRYGSVEGKLVHLSATTFEDAEKESFYKGKVALSHPYVGNNPDRNLILPGMTATVDILSGRKTLLDYLLKPIHTTLAQSFRER